MSYQGDIRLGGTIGWKFTTRQVSGVPTTLAGTPVVSVYAAGSNTPITGGVTLTVDFPKTGLNDISIVASGANGFATATNYDVVITTGTVNSVSVVGEVIGSFSIENRSALMPATSGRTLVVDAAGLADANTVKVGPTGSGTAQTAGDIPARQTDAVLAGAIWNAATATYGSAGSYGLLIETDLDATISSRSTFAGGAVSSVTGNVGGNVTGSVGSVVGAVGSVTGNVGGNVTGSVGSVVGLTASNLDATVSSRLAAASYTAPDNTTITAINAKTSLLNFTVSGQVDANVQYVNDVQVKGAGTDASPWNPV